MEQSDLLRFLCNHLSHLGIRYFITGSQATIAYGEPRFTNDIDVVIDLDETTCQSFCDGFPEEDYYLNRETAQQEVNRRGMFKIIHPSSGLKIDVVIPSRDPLDEGRFDRSVPIPIAEGFTAQFSSPEDIILQKLKWHQIGGGDRHLRDITGILKVRGESLDRSFIEEQATQLGVADVWNDLLKRIGSK